MSCAAPEQGGPFDAADAAGKTVIQGTVTKDGAPVPAAFVRLLDGGGEFTAEVVAGPAGQFRFFAAPGSWTVRALAPGASGTAAVSAGAGLNAVEVALV